MANPTWASVFDDVSRAVPTESIRERLRSRREADSTKDRGSPETTSSGGLPQPRIDPDPTRVVVDADVLVADVLRHDPSREALDRIRSHSWLTLVLSRPLIEDGRALLVEFESRTLAEHWQTVLDRTGRLVEPTAGGHPALATAHAAQAAQVLSLDETLTDVATGAAIRSTVDASVKTPTAFTSTIDLASLYAVGTAKSPAEYPGPDLDPRG